MRSALWTAFWIAIGTIEIWWKAFWSKLRWILDGVGLAKLPSDLGDIFDGRGMSATSILLLAIAVVALYLTNREFWHDLLAKIRNPSDLRSRVTAPVIGMIIFGGGFLACLIWFFSTAGSQDEARRAIAKIDAETSERHAKDPTDSALDQTFMRKDDGPIEWRFDKPVTIFGFSRRIGEGVWVDAIQIHATNKTDRALKGVKATITPDMTDKPMEMRVNPHGIILRPDESATLIPPRAKFDLMLIVPSKSDRVQGLPAEQFLTDYGSLKFTFEYNNATFTHEFPLSYLEDQIQFLEERTKEMRRPPPGAGKKSDIAKARLQLAQLREDGVKMRNNAKNFLDSSAFTYDTRDWMERVSMAIELIDEADALAFKTLDAVPPPRIPHHPGASQGLAKAYREHDFRLVKLERLIEKYGQRA